MTGKSTCGRGATGRYVNASEPASRSASVSNEVPIGCLMNGAEIFISSLQRNFRLVRYFLEPESFKSLCQSVEPQIHDGSGEQCQQLADQQSSDDRNAQRMT